MTELVSGYCCFVIFLHYKIFAFTLEEMEKKKEKQMNLPSYAENSGCLLYISDQFYIV